MKGKIAKFLSLFVSLTALFLFFLPQIGSSPIGKGWIAKPIQNRTGIEVKIGSASLSWFGPQRLSDVEWMETSVLTPESRSILPAGILKQVESNSPLWSFSFPFRFQNGSIFYRGQTIEKIEGEIRKKEEGASIDLRIDAPYLKADFQGDWTGSSITLRQPFEALISLPFEINRLFSEPFDFASLKKTACFLKIEPEDFLLSLSNSLSELRIGKGSLEMGKVEWGALELEWIAPFLSLFQETDQPLPSLSLWSTPIRFGLEKGVLEIERTDLLLADSIPCCVWGNIDLIQDRIDMILGFPASFLEQSFGIRDLPSNYVFKVDIRGTTRHPKIGKKKGRAKIGALLAAAKMGKHWKSIPFKELIWTIEEDEETPPPNRPFPWEK